MIVTYTQYKLLEWIVTADLHLVDPPQSYADLLLDAKRCLCGAPDPVQKPWIVACFRHRYTNYEEVVNEVRPQIEAIAQQYRTSATKVRYIGGDLDAYVLLKNRVHVLYHDWLSTVEDAPKVEDFFVNKEVAA